MSETKEIITTQKAYYKDILYGRGVKLEVPATLKGKWFVNASDFVPDEPEEEEHQPETFSELANQPVKTAVKRGRHPKVRE